MNLEATFEALRDAINSERLRDASIDELNTYASALCHPLAFTHFGAAQFPHVCETVRMMVQVRIITNLDQKNGYVQTMMLILTIASVIATIIQAYIAIRPPLPMPVALAPVALQPTQRESQASLQAHPERQASGQPKR